MTKKPIIGIGPHYLTNPKGRKVIGCYEGYIRCIEKAGGSALMLTADLKNIDYHLSIVDGILISGGDDIHPEYYKEKKLSKIKMELSPDERTDYDLKLIKETLKRNMPYFGICLGAQSLNVVQGGSLYQDLPSQVNPVQDHTKGQHSIQLVKGTQFHKIIKEDKIKVNSYHHQSVKDLGKNIVVSAHANDGVIEAIESTKHSFAIGVQWHPEQALKSDVSTKLFKKFIKASKASQGVLFSYKK